MSVVALTTLSACGGGDADHWDEFQPRPATATDLANQTFEFRDFSYGAVFDASLSSTPTRLAFLGPTAADAEWRLPFALTARAATSSGTATLAGDQLVLTFQTTDPVLPFTTATPIALRVTADVNDGRIQLVNTETGVSQTSAPR
ncbi:hypothetical protein [Aquabacterium sp. J223]|uniref:hypothetical protein n=1 Tax=Aquabacterium sp. J223 TaxID=2898431 RepID=UPI0021ADB5DA|nr:hypothetical protein [Aquabacterium sp. J223]UUX97703.1 hypothetical protein LRS07_10980 [Aquabacterium sp. J223]